MITKRQRTKQLVIDNIDKIDGDLTTHKMSRLLCELARNGNSKEKLALSWYHKAEHKQCVKLMNEIIKATNAQNDVIEDVEYVDSLIVKRLKIEIERHKGELNSLLDEMAYDHEKKGMPWISDAQEKNYLNRILGTLEDILNTTNEEAKS